MDEEWWNGDSRFWILRGSVCVSCGVRNGEMEWGVNECQMNEVCVVYIGREWVRMWLQCM